MTKKVPVRVNERGLRIGESHHRALLSDVEIDQMFSDRGKGLSLRALAKKYGMSASGVKAILDGKRRGQIGERRDKTPTRRVKQKMVRSVVLLTVYERAALRRLGGNKWVREMLEKQRFMCTPKNKNPL